MPSTCEHVLNGLVDIVLALKGPKPDRLDAVLLHDVFQER